MDALFFSIIVPAYNVEKYIQDCVKSIIGQSFTQYEVLLVDDGSKDSTPELCEQISAQYKKVRVIHKENGGLSSSRNAGIRQAKGRYILFLDGDDELEDGGLEMLYRTIQSQGTPDICIGRLRIVANQGTYFSVKDEPMELDETDSHRRDEALQYILLRPYLHSACKVIVKRDFLEANSIYFKEGIYHEDELWVANVLVKIKTFCVCNHWFYRYKLNGNSIMTTQNTQKILDRVGIASDLWELAQAYSADDIAFAYLQSRVKNLVYSAFTEVLPYAQQDVKNVTNKIAVLADRDKTCISKIRIYPISKILGFRAAFWGYYQYYRVRRYFA